MLLVAAWWLWRRQRSKVAAFLVFWFVLTLAPAVIVAPMVLQHDRYLYILPYAFCALVAWAILRLGSLRNTTRLVVALCVVASGVGLTWHEMGYWDCDMTLWSRVLQISPSQQKAQVQMASLYRRPEISPGSRHAERRIALPSEFSESLAGAGRHSSRQQTDWTRRGRRISR